MLPAAEFQTAPTRPLADSECQPTCLPRANEEIAPVRVYTTSRVREPSVRSNISTEPARGTRKTQSIETAGQRHAVSPTINIDTVRTSTMNRRASRLDYANDPKKTSSNRIVPAVRPRTTSCVIPPPCRAGPNSLRIAPTCSNGDGDSAPFANSIGANIVSGPCSRDLSDEARRVTMKQIPTRLDIFEVAQRIAEGERSAGDCRSLVQCWFRTESARAINRACRSLVNRAARSGVVPITVVRAPTRAPRRRSYARTRQPGPSLRAVSAMTAPRYAFRHLVGGRAPARASGTQTFASPHATAAYRSRSRCP